MIFKLSYSDQKPMNKILGCFNYVILIISLICSTPAVSAVNKRNYMALLLTKKLKW